MTTIEINNFLSLFPDNLMKISVREQELSLLLYKMLSLGNPVSIDQLSTASSLPLEDIQSIFDGWGSEVHWDENKNIVGFFGLSLVKTSHILESAGIMLYTWCAWDTLFIPALIQKTVTIRSSCPVTRQEVKLCLSPSEILSVQPASAAMSLIAPDTDHISDNVTGTFCCHIHFFATSEIAKKWSAQNPGTYIVSIDDAHKLGQKKNKLRYPMVL